MTGGNHEQSGSNQSGDSEGADTDASLRIEEEGGGGDVCGDLDSRIGSEAPPSLNSDINPLHIEQSEQGEEAREEDIMSEEAKSLLVLRVKVIAS